MSDTEWKMSELGEAAYISYHRDLAYRRRRSIRQGFNLPELPPEAPEWDDIPKRERSAWTAAAIAVAAMVNPRASEPNGNGKEGV